MKDEKPRPRYPSDEARIKVQPHVRIHHSVANHPKTAALWANLETRSMLVELWRLGSVYGAAHTGGWLTLRPSDICSVTGRKRAGSGLEPLSKLAASMEYPLRYERGCVLIQIRNFARKQGLTPRRNGVAPHTPHSSPNPPPQPRPRKDK
jgi:hypothetical protein